MSRSANAISLDELIRGLAVNRLGNSGDVSITAMTEDSRVATPGSLFVARRGTQVDGRRFVGDAVKAGAVAVLTDDPDLDTGEAARIVCDDVPTISAVLAERFFGEPSQALTVIGITGTNGKTTTAHLIHELLNKAGLKCGLMGTILIDDGQGPRPASLTTPSAIEISKTLSRMVGNGCEYAVMEVSSHALDQQRVAGLRFRAAVFTNLSGDHLDYHETMNAYADAKAKLFVMLDDDGLAVVNADDPAAERQVANCKTARLVTCRLSANGEAVARATVHDIRADGTTVTLDGPWGTIELTLPLPGEHNAANALQAAVVAHAAGLNRSQLGDLLSECHAPPGRLEPVSTEGASLAVFVDYAHTDNALENVLRAARPLVVEGARLIAVFGCGGDRDKTKRPRMAEVACRLADAVVITSDNPRTEKPDAIIADILTGITAETKSKLLFVESDRRVAIQKTIQQAREGDIIIIAGKGHEDYQIIGTTKYPFDDREIARETLAGIAAATT